MKHSKPVRCLIRENGKTGKPENETRLVGTVSNCAYVVRLETAPTGGRKCLFIFRIHYSIGIRRSLLQEN